jgi:thiamine pyrophosphokinase
MRTPIVHSLEPVSLIGGGIVGKHDLALALGYAPMLVAADGGAAKALQAGQDPVAVIGDFDSLSASDRARIAPDRLFPIREQDTTDFDKALRHISAPVVLGIGFLGGRLDHQLAAFNILLRHANRPCVLLGPKEVIFHAPPRLELNLAPGDIVSLFPLLRVTGASRGLEWPIDGLVLQPGGRIGTSNRALGPVRLDMDGPGALVIVPRAALGAVMRAFAPDRPGPPASVAEVAAETVVSPKPARWPAREG